MKTWETWGVVGVSGLLIIAAWITGSEPNLGAPAEVIGR